ncbi:MAG: hypothetical protein E7616_10525 [Ruminococcaceae bacterium]|nr:hypothetical protein [Oscillospiraceae bacterium]
MEENTETILSESITKSSLPTVGVEDVFSNAVEIKDSILSKETFTINGSVCIEGKSVALDEYCDFSDFSKYEITEWAHTIGVISEEEAIDCLCQLILDRNFDNMNCLEGIMDRIAQYQKNNIVSADLENKIYRVLSPITYGTSTDDSTSSRAISSERLYVNDYFTVHYDAAGGVNAYLEAVAVANYFTEVRSAYISMGFTTPILQSGETTYHVYLDPASSSTTNTTAATARVETAANKCASYIILYDFASLNDDVKQQIAHEYFHAIQNAYNYQSGWLKEAMANWGKITVTNMSSTCDQNIISFINGSIIEEGISMPATDGYGAVLFPLAIHQKYGANAILDIYEEYETWTSTALTLAQLRQVITNGIQAGTPSGSFNEAYRAMASYMMNPGHYFANASESSINWENDNISYIPSSTTVTYTFTEQINYLTSDYYTIALPTNVPTSCVRVAVTFSGENGYIQKYIMNNTGGNNLSYITTMYGEAAFTETTMGTYVQELGFIVSNLNNSGSLTYTVNITVMPRNETFTIPASARYTERALYLATGIESDLYVTPSVTGAKMIQTLGLTDTYIRVFDNATNTELTSDDNDGFQNNAFLRVTMEAGKCYRIHVSLSPNTSTGGNAKLVITHTSYLIDNSATSISSFEDIWTVTGQTSYSQGSSIVQYHVKALVFVPPSSGTYTIKTTGNVDTYLYVLNPRVSNLITTADYDDDSGDGSNAMLTKTLTGNIPYLIFYSSYNPSSSSMVGTITIQINKTS